MGVEPTALAALQVAGAAAGVLILAGLWTPVAGLLAGIEQLSMAFTNTAIPSQSIILAVLAVGLAMIGPGAWSVDARLYGRKQILPPES